jgi:hypothetical protein
VDASIQETGWNRFITVFPLRILTLFTASLLWEKEPNTAERNGFFSQYLIIRHVFTGGEMRNYK